MQCSGVFRRSHSFSKTSRGELNGGCSQAAALLDGHVLVPPHHHVAVVVDEEYLGRRQLYGSALGLFGALGVDEMNLNVRIGGAQNYGCSGLHSPMFARWHDS